MHTVNLAEKFSKFQDYCSPRVIGEVNDCHVKAVKLKGEFVWHHHDQEDELFLVVKGTLRMRFRDNLLSDCRCRRPRIERWRIPQTPHAKTRTCS